MTLQVKAFLFLFLLINTLYPVANAASLNKEKIDDQEILLLDVVLNNATLARSVDAYLVDEKLMIAIEPLFDALKIRYLIDETKLTIWKNEIANEYDLVESNASKTKYRWASDDFYFFIDFALFKELYPTQMEYLPRALQLKISVPEKVALFPYQIINRQNERRLLEKAVGSRQRSVEQQIPITIPDQYRLFTVPHGRVNIAAEKTSRDSGLNTSLQLTSDLLFHSAELTLSDSSDTELSARLALSRYKKSPEDRILGVFDEYKLGDISGQTNSLTSSAGSGVGMAFYRRPEGFRPSSQEITLEVSAYPGWEAELFHNRDFIAVTTVPPDGLLVFENIEVTYGANTYEIKLYGPFGEEEVITKRIDLTQNALAKGELAHSFYGLDKNHRLINDPNNESYEINNYGASFDYGISDSWQIGMGYTVLESDKEFINMKNAISLPGILLENDISFDQEGNYAQLTTLLGRVFQEDSYSLSIESAEDFQSDQISVVGSSTKYDASYNKAVNNIYLTFNANYTETDTFEQYSLRNQISGYLGRVRYSHSLTYAESKRPDTSSTGETEFSTLIGSLGLSGSLPFNTRISGILDYAPEEDDKILNSSRVRLQKRIADVWSGNHYLTADYLPLVNENSAKWRFGHNVSWPAKSFQLTLSSNYDEEENWGVQMGLQFFLGYDYQNNRMLFNDLLPGNTASLDVHTYLDRQINGVPDPLDYDLSGVEFSGNPEWEGIVTGKEGRAVLPGVYAQTPFSFSAKWKQGSNAINNDYVVYTHPGAYVDVNMPFILSTDIAGFVYRTQGGNEAGLQNVTVQLFDADNKLLRTQETDIDGYYEFFGLVPGSFIVRVADQELTEKNYTSDQVGFKLITSGGGGFVELPALKLSRLSSSDSRKKEAIRQFSLSDENSEVVVWDDDSNIRRNYFTLPAKNKVAAKHSLTQIPAAENDESSEESLVDNSVVARKDPEGTIDKKKRDKKKHYLSSSEELAPTGALPTISFTQIAASDASLSVKELPAEVVSDVAKPKVLSEAVKPKAVKDGDYTIQLGAFKDKALAEALQKKLVGSTLNVSSFQIIKRPAESIYRLTYGDFISKQEGEKFAKANLPPKQPYYVRKK